jgi:hypothetical protein
MIRDEYPESYFWDLGISFLVKHTKILSGSGMEMSDPGYWIRD